MILDRTLFNATSYGSAKKILCRCDVCGEEQMIAKQKIVARGDDYARCRRCHYDRNPVKAKSMVKVTCRDCGAPHQKRADSIACWNGRCSSCASKEVTSRADVKEAMRKNGIAVIKRVGKLPHYRDRNYRYGADNNKWRGGITSETQKIRHSIDMKQWRIGVFERDNYTCVTCGKRGGDIHADHIKPFSLYPELRFELDNGRTLCVPCHRIYGALVCNGVITRQSSDGANRRTI